MTHHTTAKHFEVFKEACRKWLEFFGLSEWEVYFAHRKREKGLATCAWNAATMTATITLNKSWFHDTPTNKWVAAVALHEIVHLLLARLSSLAITRYVGEDEMDQEAEALANKIEHIIQKLEAK